MNRPVAEFCGAQIPQARDRYRKLVMAAGLFLLALSLFAQDATNSPASRPDVAPELPSPLVRKSPVAYFRELLAMSPIERNQSLTNRPPEVRQRIQEKIREYLKLSRDERDVRLQVTELRWYLLPLLNSVPESRGPQLAAVPQEMRSLIDDRLREWDKLPKGYQTELLYYYGIMTNLETTNGPLVRLIQSPSPGQQDKWQQLSPEQREQIVHRFELYFSLTDDERKKTLNILSDAERKQIEKTLKDFAQLTPPQRSRCIRSFEKFANLSPEERQCFLQNVSCWQKMTPADRDNWRDLVRNQPLLPPLPPGIGTRPPPPPPVFPRPQGKAVATNGN